MYDSISNLENAQAYASRLGFAVFPVHTMEGSVCSCGKADCDRPAKHPLTNNGLTGAAKDEATLQRYFGGPYAAANIAAATGTPSGVWVLDIDDLSALVTLESEYGPLPPTWTVETGGGGRHFYFRYSGDVEIRNSESKIAPGIDVRGDGGYANLPPTLHVSGKRHRWSVSPDDAPIADAPAWLVTLARESNKKTATGSNPVARGGERSVPPVADRGNGGEVKRGTAHDADAEPLPPNSSPPVQSPGETFTIAAADHSPSGRLLGYLRNTPPAISGSGGHSHTFGVVCRCVERFGDLTDDELIDALASWNARCVPPWSEGDLRHKVADARQRVGSRASGSAPATAYAVATNDDGSDIEDADDPLTLSEDAYCGLIGEIVRAVDPHTEADPAGVLLSLLACFGSAIGNAPRFEVGCDSHGGNLFVALVGDTASGKGQAWNIAKRMMREADPEWSNDCIAYGLASGEGLVERLSDPADVDAFAPPTSKRLLCVETEFARPIAAMRRDGSTLSPMLRSAWDSQPLEVNTRSKTKLRASNAHVSIIAHVTESELRKLIGGSVETTNGFANRFLWCCVRSEKSLPHGGDPNVLLSFVDRFAEALAKAKTMRRLTRSAEADRLWEGVYEGLKRSTCKAAERGRPIVLRLASLYALTEGSPVVEASHLKAALAVWRYCEASAVRLFDDDEDEPEAATLDGKILRIVRQQPGILRSALCASISKRITAAEYDAVFGRLSSAGRITIVSVHEPGRRRAERLYVAGGEVIGGTAPVAEQTSPPPTSPPVPPPAKAVAEGDFYADFGVAPQPASLTDLIDAMNRTSATVFKRDDGTYWVTPDDDLTPALRASIETHQATLASLVPREAERPFA